MALRPSKWRGRARFRAGLLRSERGAVFFEFTLVLPLFLSLVLGVYTGGLAYSKKIALVESVREGARYGVSMSPPTATAIAAALALGQDPYAALKESIKQRVVSAANGDVAYADVCVAFVLPSMVTTTTTPAADCGLPDPPGASSEATIHLVKVTARRPVKMEFFFFTKNAVLTGSMVARYERDSG